MKNWLVDVLSYLFLGVMFIGTIAGCSLFGGSSEEKPVVAPVAEVKTEIQIVERARVSKREPSSLWSDASKWNGLYGQPVGRGTGSVILLKPTDGFRLRIANRSGKGSGLEGPSIRENQNVVAQVTEVHPNAIFSISAKQTLTVGHKDHAFELTGRIREADVGADETASTDALFEVNLKVEGEVDSPKIAAVEPAKVPVADTEKRGADVQAPADSLPREMRPGSERP